MSGRVGAAAAVGAFVLLAGYLVVRAVDLVATGELLGAGIAAAVLLLVGVTGLLVVGEVRLGLGAARLARALEAEGVDPVPADLPRLPSGRLTRDGAAELFARRKVEAEAASQDWRAWYLLAVAYGESRDTRGGRRALRHALRLARAAGGPGPGSRGKAAAPRA